MDALTVRDAHYQLHRAARSDLPELLHLLADDGLGRARELAAPSAYEEALREIDADPHQLLLAVRSDAGDLVATIQLTLIPGLSRGGTKRLLIEAVRVASSLRGSGVGAALMEWAHEYGRRHGATLAQLTSDARREDAHRFYARLGYAASHVGFKRAL